MRWIARLWRRSIQVRVVTSTLALSGVFIGATGWALLADVSDSLAASKRDAAVVDVRLATAAAQSQLDATLNASSAAQAQVLNGLVDAVTDLDPDDRVYELVLEGPLGADDVPLRSSVALRTGSVPADLRRAVVSRDGTFARYSTIAELGSDESHPSVVVGTRLRAPRTGDTYALFYVFSMEDQERAVALVRQALLFGGVASVLMVGGIAFLVSRQVLSPVRMARRISEQYARGHLETRMPVHGEDDIARLSTSFNRMAANLQLQITRLENLSMLQQRFVSDVSHELRTPLTTVQMAGSLLFENRDNYDPATARSAELLKRELDRFEDLLVNLLDLSRFDAGAAQLDVESVDLVELARESADDLGPAGLPTELVGDTTPAVVEADRRRLERILRNLLSNAARHSGSDRVELEVTQGEDVVTIIVRDFGKGLSVDEASQVFDRFWRADPARSEGGTGLGLAIAREDAALHGGSLTVRSRPQAGTEFVLTIPRRQPNLDEAGP
jgi:two-component system sensor histidine kinase MtrB